MNKIVYNTIYKVKYQIWWMLIYVLIAVGILVIVYSLLFKTGVLTPETGSLGYRLWGMLLFQFAVSMRFREDFDLFITFSNTRREFLGTQLAALSVFSIIIALCVVAEKAVVDSLNIAFGLYIKEFFHLIAVYRSTNLFQLFAFFALLSFVLSLTALLLGSLFYRFGRTFTTVFWFVTGAVPVLGIPLLIWPFGNKGYISDLIRYSGNFLIGMNISDGIVYLLLSSIPILMLTYLSINTLSQK